MENSKRSGASSHVNENNPELHLIFDKTGQARSIGSCDQTHNIQMTFRHAGAHIIKRIRLSEKSMNSNGKLVSGHSTWISDALCPIKGIACRKSMKHLKSGVSMDYFCLQKNFMNICIINGMA